MAWLIGIGSPAAGGGPELGALVAGFVLMMGGLAILTPHRHSHGPLASRTGTRRALLYALFYALCTTSFMRILSPALLGAQGSPWLLALGDVMFVTLGLFAWVMMIAEGFSFASYGLTWGRPGRMGLAFAMGVGAALLVGFESYVQLLAGHMHMNSDRTVFALLFATVGSALPEELIFRGYLQGSLSGRMRRWARIALPALAFTAVRALRFLPGSDLPFDDWMFYVFGTVLPLGLWWGLMRDWTGGSIWPGLVSHVLVALGPTLAGHTPADI
jgi:membrane protease YdiL (CAAX protease family)